MNCIWPDCKKSTSWTWLCGEHYLQKEAAYALYDVKSNPEFLKNNKDWTLNRLLAFASHRQRRAE